MWEKKCYYMHYFGGNIGEDRAKGTTGQKKQPWLLFSKSYSITEIETLQDDNISRALSFWRK